MNVRDAENTADFARSVSPLQTRCDGCNCDVGEDELFWEFPDWPYSCRLLCEECMVEGHERELRGIAVRSAAYRLRTLVDRTREFNPLRVSVRHRAVHYGPYRARVGVAVRALRFCEGRKA